ncbi:MAG: hypothetical protein ABMA00_15730 [Gemmatimonas sp.]
MPTTNNLAQRVGLFLIGALSFGALTEGVAQSTATEVLTNQQIIQMSAGGVPKGIMLIKIRITRSAYDLSSVGLVRLTASGVHREIIEAMTNATQVATANGLASTQPSDTEEVLTNDAIVRMVSGGVARSIIDAKLRSSRSSFDLSAEGLVRLKDNKVPEDLIKALLPSPSASDSHAELTVREAPNSSPVGNAAALVDRSTSRFPTPPTSARTPKSTLTRLPSSSGIYMHARDGALASLEPSMIKTEQSADMSDIAMAGGVIAARTVGAVGQALIGSLGSSRGSSFVNGRSARIRTSDSSVEFYLVLEKSKVQRGNLDESASGSPIDADQFLLVRLEPKETRRDLAYGVYTALLSHRGVKHKDVIQFDAERRGIGVFRIVPRGTLAPGEYGIITTVGSAGSARLFGFGIGKP